MSAFLVSNTHIDTLVTFAATHCGPTDIDAVAMLARENLRSLEYRYSNVAEERDAVASYQFEAVDLRRMLPPGTKATKGAIATQILKACDCFNYQACENDDYTTTPAARFIGRIRARALEMGGKASGAACDRMLWEVA